MITYAPQNWPAGAPAYDSPEGWEYQKMLARKAALTTASTIPYLIKCNNPLALVVAARLAEIVRHEDAEYMRRVVTEHALIISLSGERNKVDIEALKAFIAGREFLLRKPYSDQVHKVKTTLIFRDESNA